MGPFARYPSLQGRVVFLTGGSSGMGADMVAHFAAQGARVGFVGRNAKAAADVVRGCVEKGHPEPLFIQADLRDIAALRAAIAQTQETLGAIRVLVNNAADDERHDWKTLTPEAWDERLQVNLRHQFFAIQAVAPLMKAAGGGSIINLGSISWMNKEPGMVAYTTSKAAIQGLTRTMARALGPDEIRVNCVVPGWIITQRQIDKWLTPQAQADTLAAQCLKRMLSPPEISRMVLFLAADDSSACTSQSYVVDGGWAGL
ncbi:MAG TPA: SDR family oxidoreductase [Albitalea sp.]|nr:SDR family oxidoreductase [Albitalea sp.]